MNSASRKFAAHSPAATQPGPVSPRCRRHSPPMNGPRMNPSPNAMPMRPIFFERSAGGEYRTAASSSPGPASNRRNRNKGAHMPNRAPATVRIVRFHQTGGPEVLQLDEFPLPDPAAGEVRLRVKAIGLNRAEVMFRMGRYLI